MTQWGTETEEQPTPVPVPAKSEKRLEELEKLGYKTDTKVFIVLEDSDKETWGIARDMSDHLFDTPDKGDIIGSWTRAPYDGLIHLSLTTPLNALVDKAIQIWAMRAEQRKQAVTVTKGGVRRKVAAPVPEPSVEITMEFNNLRERLKRTSA